MKNKIKISTTLIFIILSFLVQAQNYKKAAKEMKSCESKRKMTKMMRESYLDDINHQIRIHSIQTNMYNYIICPTISANIFGRKIVELDTFFKFDSLYSPRVYIYNIFGKFIGNADVHYENLTSWNDMLNLSKKCDLIIFDKKTQEEQVNRKHNTKDIAKHIRKLNPDFIFNVTGIYGHHFYYKNEKLYMLDFATLTSRLCSSSIQK